MFGSVHSDQDPGCTEGLAGAGGDSPAAARPRQTLVMAPSPAGHNVAEPLLQALAPAPQPLPGPRPRLLGPCRPAQIVRVINADFPEIPSGFLIALGWG